jgi:hypothetical protein
VLDRNMAEAGREADPRVGSQSATFLALGLPALGLTYYRLRLTTVEGPFLAAEVAEAPPLAPAGTVQVQSLITHHAGVTLVQSLTDRVAVATTLKLVRGVAAVGPVPFDGDRDELLEEAGGLVGSGSTEFDADIGVLALVKSFRVGLTVRNVREPDFETPGDAAAIELQRQVRAGVAYTAAGGLLVSADLDLESVPGPTGLFRTFAAGAETRVTRRAAVRGGFRINTRGDQPAGRTPVGTAGVSYAAMGSILIDGQATFGSESSDRGWGVGVRVVF